MYSWALATQACGSGEYKVEQLKWHQKHKQPKKKTDQRTSNKIWNFCATKETIKKMNRQLTEWKKVCANHVFDKGPEKRKTCNSLINRQII